MKTNPSSHSVVCFGEILWDNLPAGRKPGGAPMNVAYHLHKLGINSHLISSIGNDDSGSALLNFLKDMGLAIDHVQTDFEHPTSEVIASIGDHHEVTYDIISNVAWDYIRTESAYESLVRNADAFVYGSLSSRNLQTRETLFKMLDLALYRVFDVNLREPHYTPELIMQLMERCDMIKVNAAELRQIAQWNDCLSEKEADCIEKLFQIYKLKEILITKGSQGATYYNASLRYDYPAYSISVTDTIGSGDSFLAAFLAMKVIDAPLEVTLDYAVAMGAFITAQSGACPDYSKFDFNRFLWKRKLGIQEPH